METGILTLREAARLSKITRGKDSQGTAKACVYLGFAYASFAEYLDSAGENVSKSQKSLGKAHKYYTEALSIYRSILRRTTSGKDNELRLSIASTLDFICNLQIYVKKWQMAIVSSSEILEIYSFVLGDEDERTKDAQRRLDLLNGKINAMEEAANLAYHIQDYQRAVNDDHWVPEQEDIAEEGVDLYLTRADLAAKASDWDVCYDMLTRALAEVDDSSRHNDDENDTSNRSNTGLNEEEQRFLLQVRIRNNMGVAQYFMHHARRQLIQDDRSKYPVDALRTLEELLGDADDTSSFNGNGVSVPKPSLHRRTLSTTSDSQQESHTSWHAVNAALAAKGGIASSGTHLLLLSSVRLNVAHILLEWNLYSSSNGIGEDMNQHEERKKIATKHVQSNYHTKKHIFGSNHPHTLGALDKLAQLQSAVLRNFKESILSYKLLLKGQTEFYGEHHLSVATTQGKLANLFIHMKDYESAMQSLMRVQTFQKLKLHQLTVERQQDEAAANDDGVAVAMEQNKKMLEATNLAMEKIRGLCEHNRVWI